MNNCQSQKPCGTKLLKTTLGNNKMLVIAFSFFYLAMFFKSIDLPVPFTKFRPPHSSVGNIADLRTGCRWFNLWLGQYSFRGLMVVIATGFISLPPLFVSLTVVLWESSQWLGKILCRVLVKRTPGKHG